MCLHGVVKSATILSARLGDGAATGEWVIGEFTARMQAVSKIALQRRTNLAKFLEMNGTTVSCIMQNSCLVYLCVSYNH